VQTAETQDGAWAGAIAALRAGWVVAGPVVLATEVGVVVPLTHDSFVLDGVPSSGTTGASTRVTVYSPGVVQGRMALGVEVRLPR
jgi:hypothetical protein